MPRLKTLSSTQSIFVGPTPSTGGHYASGAGKVLQRSTIAAAPTTGLVQELLRVQDYNLSFNLDNQPVNQFGDLAPIDYVPTTPPTVSLSFSYLLNNMNNEKVLGFTLCSGSLVGAISGILSKTSDDKNYFVQTVQEGQDVHQNVTTTTALGCVGNGYIGNYQLQAAVGQFPTVSVDVQGANFVVLSTFSGGNPAINPLAGTQLTSNFFEVPTGAFSTTNISGLATNANLLSVSVLRPGDVTFSLDYADLGSSTTDWKVQSVNLSIPFNRDDLNQLGSRFTVAREITPPITATLSVNAIVGDMVTGSLYDLFASCGSAGYNGVLTFRHPCQTATTLAGYIFKGMKLTSHEYTSSVGNSESVTMTFNIPIGGASATGTNVFFSGLAA